MPGRLAREVNVPPVEGASVDESVAPVDENVPPDNSSLNVVHEQTKSRELQDLFDLARQSSTFGEHEDHTDEERPWHCTKFVLQDQDKMQEWLPTLDERVNFILGNYGRMKTAADVQPFLTRYGLRSHPMCIGEGKFADVFRAYDNHRREWVALKVISFPRITKAGIPHQLKREIDIMSTLDHPNIMPLHGIVPLAFCARVVLVVEHARKELLHVIDAAHRSTGRGVVASEAVDYVRQLARAIAYLHTMDIVHRDVKPENVLLYDDGTAKLTDFGWSRIIASGERSTTLCGTLDYLSPEMIRGEGTTHKVDLFSLGVVTYEVCPQD